MTISSTGGNAEQLELSCSADGNVKWHCCFRKHLAFLKKLNIHTKEGSLPGLSPSFCWSLGLWKHNLNPHIVFSLCVNLYAKISPIYKDITHTRLGPILLQYDFILIITSITTLFPNKVTF